MYRMAWSSKPAGIVSDVPQRSAPYQTVRYVVLDVNSDGRRKRGDAEDSASKAARHGERWANHAKGQRQECGTTEGAPHRDRPPSPIYVPEAHPPSRTRRCAPRPTHVRVKLRVPRTMPMPYRAWPRTRTTNPGPSTASSGALGPLFSPVVDGEGGREGVTEGMTE